MFLVIFCYSMAVENPNVTSGYKSTTTVPSANQTPRRTNTQNPYGISGNDIVTGNVGGGRHFRGSVPYSSGYYSGAGSTSVENFIRWSQNPIVNDRNPGATRSYYNPRQTVSSFSRSGASGLSAPVVQNQSKADTYTMPALPRVDAAPVQQRPLSTNNLELDQILSRQILLREQSKELPGNDLLIQDPLQKKTFFDEPLKDQEIEKLKPKDDQQDREPAETPEMLVLKQLQQEQEKAMLEEPSQKPDEQTPEDADGSKVPGQTFTEEQLTRATGRQAMGQHDTFESLARAKYREYLVAAELFLAEGRYYKAADAYELASLWRPKDARAYLGKSFALFGAGEYMSSAYYLSRAVQLNPELAAKKYDLPAIIGNRDTYENRLIEMATWQERSGSGELAMMMAYVLYHDGKTQRAAEAMKKAFEAMPDNEAVLALKNVILPDGAGK